MRKIKITTRGCPWHDVEQSPFCDFPKGKYGWNPFKVLGWGRYGGNWAIKFGVEIGSQMTNVHFGLGTITIKYLVDAPAQKRPVKTQPEWVTDSIRAQKATDRHHVREQKIINARDSRAALVAAGIAWVEFNNGMHLRINNQYDFYPTTGLYIHCKNGSRGHGVKSLIAAVNRDTL